jgi:hypothetical protein
MGGSGNLRTLRLSAANGSRTLMSIITGGSSSGAGSTRRMYGYYAANNNSPSQFYNSVFGLHFGAFKNRQ